jgi:hypothetical protein
LSTQNLVLGLPKVSCTDGVCPGCVLGKQHQDPFPKGKALHATTPLELVHSDLMSFPTHSFSGAKYALTFIDDFSCHSWVYFLKYKSEVFATFKTFKDFVEKQSSLSIKKLCTYNGGSMSIKHSRIFVENMAFNINTMFPTPLNKMDC